MHGDRGVWRRFHRLAETRTCRLRRTAWAWKKPLWDKTVPLSEEEVERFRTTCAAIVLPQRKHRPEHFGSGCDGGVWERTVRVGTKTLFSRREDTLGHPYGDEQWDAEREAEEEALKPLDKIMREFCGKCEPPEGELDKIAEKRME